MLGHTKTHRTEAKSSSRDHSKSEDSINWKEAAKEIFGNTPSAAVNLRGLRNRERMTQTELGKAIGVEQSNVSKMERGIRAISPKIAKRLQEVFDIDYRLFL